MAKQLFFDTCINEYGKPVIGATVTVYIANTQTLATIYSDDASTVLANPTTSDTSGYFQFKLDPGEYDIVIEKSGSFSRHITGYVVFSSFDPTDVDITGGTIDGVTIGSADAVSVKASAVVADTATILGGSLDDVAITGSNISSTAISGSSVNNSSVAGSTITNSSVVNVTVQNAAVSGGSIDGTTIGAHTPAAATLTDLTYTGMFTQPAAFDPTTIPNMIAWYDASDAAKLTVDGSNNVSQWTDKSGQAYNLTSSAGLNPKYLSDDGDGKPCINFADGNQLKNATSTTASEDTFLIVVNLGTLTGSLDYIFGRGNGLLTMSSTSLDWQAAGSGDGSTGLRSAALPVKNQYIILSGRRSANANMYQGGAGNTGVIELRENGAYIKRTTHTGGSTNVPFFMGRDNNGNSTAMKVREAFWFNRYLTDAELLKMENYLNSKWNVYNNFAGRRDYHDGLQRWFTATGNTQPVVRRPLVCITGQSNAGGEAQIDPALLPAVVQGAITNALIWDNVSAFHTLQVGVNNLPDSAPAAGTVKHGIELSLMYALSIFFSGPVYLVKSFVGGTALQDRWLPTLAKNVNLWRVAEDTIEAATYSLGFNSGIDVYCLCDVSYQGEADALLGGTAITNYGTNEQIRWAASRAFNARRAKSRIYSVAVRNATEPDAAFDAVTAAKIANVGIIPNYFVTNGWTGQSPVGGPHGDSPSMINIGNTIAVLLGAGTTV